MRTRDATCPPGASQSRRGDKTTTQQDSVVGSPGSYPTLIAGVGTFGVVVRAPKRYRVLVTSPLADPWPADDAE